jgi:hypothetical protein
MSRFNITDTTSNTKFDVDGSLFVIKNSTSVLYALSVTILIVLTIIMLWSNGRLKYIPDSVADDKSEKTEKAEKKVTFKEPVKSTNSLSDEVDKEIEAINSS